MKLHNIIFSLVVMLGLFSCSEQKEQPNIIFIMSDDHAQRAISSYGHDLIQTPNIDRIANEGMLFKRSYVTNSICAPSRAVMLTGKYSHINGKKDNADTFDGSQVTYPKLLQEAGYYTAMIGKWHLKSNPTGFDYWNIVPDQGEYYNPDFIKNGKDTVYEGYVSTIITDLVIDKIKSRDKTKPFCILYHHKAPHREWMPDTAHLDFLANETIPLPDNFYDDYSHRGAAAHEQDMEIKNMFLSMDTKLHDYAMEGREENTGGNKDFYAPKYWALKYARMNEAQKAAWDKHYDSINANFKEANLQGNALTEWIYQRYMKDYLRCIKSVDENIGRVLDLLDEEGLSENTIVVYTSDQGFYLGEHGWYDKRFMYEESFCTPLMIRYPKEIEAGQVNSDFVMNIDYTPTFLDFAGIEVPEDIQGVSLRSVLNGNTPDDWRKSIYYHYYEYPHGWHLVKKHYGVRTDRYKLIHFYEDVDEWELYDLEKDPNEMKNIYFNPDNSALIDSLKLELSKLQEQYKDPIAN